MSHSQRPRLLYFGAGDLPAGTAVVLQADDGGTDNGTAYEALAITNSIVTARPSEEILCFATYVTARHYLEAPLTLACLLYVDERDPLRHEFTIPASTRAQVSRFEIGWADVVASGGSEVTQAPRGHRIRVGLEIPPATLDDNLLEVDGVECEIEILAESISPANAT